MGCHSGQNYVFTIIHNFGQHRCFTVQLMSGAVQLVSRTFKQNRKSDQHISDLVRLSPPQWKSRLPDYFRFWLNNISEVLLSLYDEGSYTVGKGVYISETKQKVVLY